MIAVSSFMICVICSVDTLVISASWRISSATTANPFPCSPARAASMDAFNASILVWFAIEMICPIHSLIFCTDAWKSSNVRWISSKCSCTSPELSFKPPTFCCASSTDFVISSRTPANCPDVSPTVSNVS